jgi:glycosyltransferase involved in cell wall biosynthesis
MTIAIDASRAVNETAGIGRYSRELIKKMIEIDKKNDYLLFFSYFRKNPEKEQQMKSFQASNVKIKTLRIPGNFKEKIWRWRLPWLEKFIGQADVFFAPSFLEVNFGLKIPQVMVIHDLTTFIYPEHRGKEVSERLSLRVQEAAKKAQKIIAVSQTTASDSVKYLKITKNKIKVIYPGLAAMPKPAKNLPGRLRTKQYLLFVGTVEPRKNLIGLFKAYALLPMVLQEKYPLVIVGAQGWNNGETYDVLKALKLEDKVKFLGFVADPVLAKLYKEAAVFVYPSLYEGFGLPVLEALSYGTPVVTSNVSSLPEVAGRAALLIDPQDPKSIASGLQRLLEGKAEVELLQNEAQKQVQKFAWEKCARQTLKVLQEVANG